MKQVTILKLREQRCSSNLYNFKYLFYRNVTDSHPISEPGAIKWCCASISENDEDEQIWPSLDPSIDSISMSRFVSEICFCITHFLS